MLRVSKDMLEASQIVPYDPPSYMQSAFILSSGKKLVCVFLVNDQRDAQIIFYVFIYIYI